MGSNKKHASSQIEPGVNSDSTNSETVNIVDTYMYMVVETNEFAREYRVRKN